MLNDAQDQRRLTVLSAFTGLGGLDLGIEAAGYEHVGCIEIDALARLSLKANRGERWPLLDPGDISILAEELEPADLGLRARELFAIVAGPPCQAFSKAAQWAESARAGFLDPTSKCTFGLIALVERFLPEVLMIENVPGYLRGPTSALGALNEMLSAINRREDTQYELQHRVLNAVDHGVPQRRERVIAVALRGGQRFEWPPATHASKPIRAWDAIGGLKSHGSLPTVGGKWARLLPSIPEGKNYLWHTRKGGGREIFGYRTRFWSFLLKLAKDEPSWTIPAQPGPATGPFHWENRPLSGEELLRLQTFPVTWCVEGDYRSQVRQIGNATPPLLTEVLGRALATQVAGRRYTDVSLSHEIRRKRLVPRAESVGRVPTGFVRLAGPRSDHPGTGLGPRPRPVTDP